MQFRNLFVFVTSFIAYASSESPMSCLVCVGSAYGGNATKFIQCLNQPDKVRKIQCRHLRYYCRTMMELRNGEVSLVQRGCADPQRDHDQSTRFKPQHPHCVTSTDVLNGVETTTCFYPCRYNDCNNVTSSSIRQCKGSCLAEDDRGHCDFTSGKCVCESGWAGENCDRNVDTSFDYRRCVQCTEDVEPDCPIKKSTELCPDNTSTYNFCSTTITATFDQNGNMIRSHVIRGCSTTHTHSDRCYFSTPFDPNGSDDVEYTCKSTCEANGCNTGLPDGVITELENNSLYCLVCEDGNDDGECAMGRTARSLCPARSRYCKSTVTYYLSERNDLQYMAEPEYRFGKIVRSCSSRPVATACRNRTFSVISKVKRFVCEESCSGDGCNTGWPARPKCSQCNSSYTSEGYDSCLADPAWPTQCRKPYEGYCVTIDYKLKGRNSYKSYDGFKRIIRRGCSYHDVGSSCSDLTFQGVEAENCNKTCTTTGCNLGNTSNTLRFDPVMFVLILLMALSFL